MELELERDGFALERKIERREAKQGATRQTYQRLFSALVVYLTGFHMIAIEIVCLKH